MAGTGLFSALMMGVAFGSLVPIGLERARRSRMGRNQRSSRPIDNHSGSLTLPTQYAAPIVYYPSHAPLADGVAVTHANPLSSVSASTAAGLPLPLKP